MLNIHFFCYSAFNHGEIELLFFENRGNYYSYIYINSQDIFNKNRFKRIAIHSHNEIFFFPRDSIYHSHRNTWFQTQSERQLTRKFRKQRCRTNGYKKNVDKDGSSPVQYLRVLLCTCLF